GARRLERRGLMADPPDGRSKPDITWDGSYLTGRSLTMREYLDAILWWVDSHYREIPESWHTPFPDEDARREHLKRHIQDREERSMLKRYGRGEDWQAIKAATRGGRFE
ncbi:MAG: hypothetical protein QOH38_1140, partial [Thermoleophilaceae bacterium]|nr:hypothetical protein [Thermoleophilaceae bacterium]